MCALELAFRHFCKKNISIKINRPARCSLPEISNICQFFFFVSFSNHRTAEMTPSSRSSINLYKSLSALAQKRNKTWSQTSQCLNIYSRYLLVSPNRFEARSFFSVSDLQLLFLYLRHVNQVTRRNLLPHASTKLPRGRRIISSLQKSLFNENFGSGKKG